jgi:alpha-tubulin suppressor-like RCC1 family protein
MSVWSNAPPFTHVQRRRVRVRVFAVALVLVVVSASIGAVALARANRDPGFARVTQISVGFEHACALRTDKSIRCWGRNTTGAFGAGRIAREVEPAGLPTQQVSLHARARSVSSGARHVCALLEDESVSCWGAGSDGQLGNGTLIDRPLPARVALRRVTAIDAGVAHTCAVHDRGRVSCWGLNDHGQTGADPSEDSLTPTPVKGIVHATQVSTGYYHSCALEQRGTVSCWGTNDQDQLGSVNNESSSVARSVPNLVDVTQIDGGTWNTCARTKKGQAFCWGVDFFSTGAVGPVLVDGLPSVSSVSVGSNHACAVAVDHTVWCWGKNDSGQLGTGTIDDARTAQQVRQLRDVDDVSVGLQNSCARSKTQHVFCWGENIRFAVVGAPTRLPFSSVPVRVVGYNQKPTREATKIISRLKKFFD